MIEKYGIYFFNHNDFREGKESQGNPHYFAGGVGNSKIVCHT